MDWNVDSSFIDVYNVGGDFNISAFLPHISHNFYSFSKNHHSEDKESWNQTMNIYKGIKFLTRQGWNQGKQF